MNRFSLQMNTLTRVLLTVAVAAAIVLPAACGGGGGGSTAADDPTPITVRGGSASVGAGALGGSGGGGASVISAGGDVFISPSGSADASFPAPTYTPSMGANSYTVSVDTDVQLNVDAVPGGLYANGTTDPSSVRLYEGDGDGNTGNDPAVTGLVVQAGVTLTLISASDTDGTSYAGYLFANDVFVYGILKTFYDWAPLQLILTDGNDGKVVVETGGLISTVPTAAGEPGTRIDITTDGDIIVKGDVFVNGTAPGGSAGAGAYFETYNGHFHMTGSVRADGADHPTGTGGNGGEIFAFSDVGDVILNGTMTSNGGDGGAGDGGNSWYILAIAGYDGTDPGDLYARGTFSANGGDSVGGAGGDAKNVKLANDSTGGVLKVNATLLATGGNATGAGAAGGHGANIWLDNASGGLLQVSGTIDGSGGNGVIAGGSPGRFVFRRTDPGAPTGASLDILGFSAIDATGGSGDTGGRGSDLQFFSGGTVTCGIPLSTEGGDGTVTGGDGGDVTIFSGVGPSDIAAGIDLGGGTGGTTNGVDGTLSLD